MNTAQIYLPKISLRRYIDHYMMVDIDWHASPNMANKWRLIPFGQISMLFLYGDTHQYSLSGELTKTETTPHSFMVGQLRQPIWLNFQGHTRLTKVQFRAAGLQQIMPVSMDEFADVPCIALKDIWANHGEDISEQLYHATNDGARVDILDGFFEQKLLPENPQSAYVEYTLKQLYCNTGTYRVNDLQEQLGISARHLERVFKSIVGLSPKEISQFIRLNAAFSTLEKKPDQSLSSLAYELGYFDPAHFSKDFTRLTGLAPSRLLKKDQKECFVTHGKCFAALPGISV